MSTLSQSRTLSVSIARAINDVYRFVVSPMNLPEWAPGFAQSVSKVGDAWVVETRDGPMEVVFAPENPFGVADHVVTMGDGTKVFNPMRVVANGDGTEVLFTLFQTPDTADRVFDEIAAVVASDLSKLKGLLEAG